MKKCLAWSVVILGIVTLMSFGQTNSEQDFLNRAAIANRFEIALANQALERSSNEEVKGYARMLIDEHEKLLNQLNQYATSKKIEVSNDLDQEHLAQLDALKELTVESYDNSFKNTVIATHQKSISLFESAATDESITDSVLKTWITDTLPFLKSHLAQAQELKIGIENEPTTMP